VSAERQCLERALAAARTESARLHSLTTEQAAKEFGPARPMPGIIIRTVILGASAVYGFILGPTWEPPMNPFLFKGRRRALH
jgi:hypothetical protein